MFHFVLFVLYLYVVWRFVFPLPWRMRYHVLLAIVLLLTSKYHLIQQWVFGTMFSPEIPRAWVVLFGGLFCVFVLLFFLTAVFDVLLGVVWLVRRGRAGDERFRTRARYIVGIAALVLSVIGVHQAMQIPEVRRIELTLHDLPPTLDGFRLVQLTDLHISRLLNGSWARRVVERTNALNPDLIVITGDLIDGTVSARHDDVKPLRDLRARHGVVTILGNHEYYFNAAQWTDVFEQLGMRVLVNQHQRISVDGVGLVVVGLADLAALEYGQPGPDAAHALQDVPHEAATVLLTHRPVDTAMHAQSGVDLQLAGHTHGGMIRGFDALMVAPLNDGFASGYYSVADMHLYVSNGTGLWNGFPIRLGVPAEITEITLRSPDR
ncbi:metallophosphoesterase [Dickeya zeae]|uniref:metallophosphoesterase n=1 Tax=Dickeya zeae TaxID=204042 RepID=UPI001C62EC1D|nr:metallophosphoesterase [Dickeya zeae]